MALEILSLVMSILFCLGNILSLRVVLAVVLAAPYLIPFPPPQLKKKEKRKHLCAPEALSRLFGTIQCL